jgi:hypothetical protein
MSIDWIEALKQGETVTDIGQIPPDQKRKIRALVKSGLVVRCTNWNYPTPKPAYVHRNEPPVPNVTYGKPGDR